MKYISTLVSYWKIVSCLIFHIYEVIWHTTAGLRHQQHSKKKVAQFWNHGNFLTFWPLAYWNSNFSIFSFHCLIKQTKIFIHSKFRLYPTHIVKDICLLMIWAVKMWNYRFFRKSNSSHWRHEKFARQTPGGDAQPHCPSIHGQSKTVTQNDFKFFFGLSTILLEGSECMLPDFLLYRHVKTFFMC